MERFFALFRVRPFVFHAHRFQHHHIVVILQVYRDVELQDALAVPLSQRNALRAVSRGQRKPHLLRRVVRLAAPLEHPCPHSLSGGGNPVLDHFQKPPAAGLAVVFQQAPVFERRIEGRPLADGVQRVFQQEGQTTVGRGLVHTPQHTTEGTAGNGAPPVRVTEEIILLQEPFRVRGAVSPILRDGGRARPVRGLRLRFPVSGTVRDNQRRFRCQFHVNPAAPQFGRVRVILVQRLPGWRGHVPVRSAVKGYKVIRIDGLPFIQTFAFLPALILYHRKSPFHCVSDSGSKPARR